MKIKFVNTPKKLKIAYLAGKCLMQLKKKIRNLFSIQISFPMEILTVPSDDDMMPHVWVDLEAMNKNLEPYGIKFEPEMEK
jgi:hypothetical protein